MPTNRYDPTWSETERFIWDCAVKGEVANLNTRDGFTCPVDSPCDWPDERTVSAAFLETILTDEERKRAIHPRGLRMFGARFVEPISIRNRTFPFPLWIAYSRFEKEVGASDLVAEEVVSFEYTVFANHLSLQRASFKKSLLMRNVVFREVDLLGARIGDALDIKNSTAKGKLQMDSVQVGGPLFMGDGAVFKDVVLNSARIGGQLDIDKATVKGMLCMDGLKVEGNCIAHYLKLLSALSAPGAHFMGSVDFPCAIFAPAEGKEISCVDFSGATIKGELQFWQPNDEGVAARWDRTALILRNVTCGSLQDHPDGWPEVLDLTGFTYERFGGLGGGAEGSLAHRDEGWLLQWLDRQADGKTLLAYRDNDLLPKNVEERDRFSPQPYRQLASVLEKEGFPGKARAVLYAMQSKAHKMARLDGRWKSWLWMWLEKVFIGYGYYNFRTVYSSFILFVVGVGVLHFSGEGAAHGMPCGLSYSFDMLLPIIELRKSHYDIDLADGVRHYFYFHQIMGYVLALFLGAGLAGLTKK